MSECSLVSVIVPVYNVGRYLDVCIESVVNQTYDNIEIILVDDGSQDDSPIICDKWANKDKRIRVIHKSNEGVSSARNTGLDICTGEYIMFLDGDDWYDKNAVEIVLKYAQKGNLDIVWFGTRKIYNDRIENIEFKHGMQLKEAIGRVAIDTVFIGACDKLYRREIWDGIRFPNISYEDGYVICKMLRQPVNLLTIGDCLYNYRRNGVQKTIVDKAPDNPRQEFCFWKWKEQALKLFSEKGYEDFYQQYFPITIKHALKAYIINMGIHCLTEDEKAELSAFLNEHYLDRGCLNLEYRAYYWSYKNFNLYNKIKSIDFWYRYR